MPWQDVCLSVCPSICHMPVLSLNGYTYPQEFFHHRVDYPNQTGWQYSDGDPPNEGTECHEQITINLRPISGFISELMQDRALVTMEG